MRRPRRSSRPLSHIPRTGIRYWGADADEREKITRDYVLTFTKVNGLAPCYFILRGKQVML